MLIRMGAIVEVGIPNKHAGKYKTLQGLERFVTNLVLQFCQSNPNFDGLPSQLNSYTHDIPLEVKDFKYSQYNKCAQNRTHRVFRHFGCDFLFEGGSLRSPEPLFATYHFEFRGMLVLVCLCNGFMSSYMGPTAKFIKRT